MTAPHPLVAALAEERKRRSLSRADLARRTGYSHESIRKWENGVTTPDIDRMTDLAAALGYRLAVIPAEKRPTGPPLPLITAEQAARNRAMLAAAIGTKDDL